IRTAFEAKGVGEAWPRVVAVVVQPGVDFSDTSVVDYDRHKAVELKQAIEAHPTLVYEAHSTDYQQPAALAALVEDHFAILKVGRWLTFALREAMFALAQIEREWLGARRGVELSRLRLVMDDVMAKQPEHWKGHYHGDDSEVRFARAFSYSDRIRYYWPNPKASTAVHRLFENLASPPPLSLVSQYLPGEYWRARQGGENWNPRSVVVRAIRQVLDHYAQACKGDPR